MTAWTPPIGRGSPSTKDSSGNTVVLALTSPSSSMTWTWSRSSLGFWAGSKFFSQSEMLAPNAAFPTRPNASISPSRYLRSSIILRLSKVGPDSTGSAPSWLAAGPALHGGRFPPLDGISHPPAPLGVLPFVADAAPERGVGGEPRGVRILHLRLVLVLHPGSQRLVVRELLLTL